MGKKSTETRSIVLEIISVMEDDPKEKLHILLRNVLDKYDYMDARDKALIKRLSEGVISQKIKLDYVISCYAKTKNGKIKPVIRNILRMGIYQILFMDSIPDSAACNEAVLLASEKGFYGLKGFVNGVLRRIVREKDVIPWPAEKPEKNYLSVMYSMPEWIVDKWLENYGRKRTESILRGMTEISDLTLRVKETLSEKEKEQLLAKFEECGKKLISHPYLSYAYWGKGSSGVDALPGYREGLFAVQDVSSMLAVEVAGIKEGDLVLDVCAAPGGKSMHAALKTGEKGKVISRDLLPYKVDLIAENANRMKLKNLKVQQWDACQKDEALVGKVDVVIADLPCSGLGVMGRKGDIRYHVTPESLKELAVLQREILQVVQEYVKPGGTLIYSTCTINREENEENRKWFLEKFSYDAVSIEEQLPRELKSQGGKEGHLQLFPGVHLSDGFYIAKFRKGGK